MHKISANLRLRKKRFLVKLALDKLKKLDYYLIRHLSKTVIRLIFMVLIKDREVAMSEVACEKEKQVRAVITKTYTENSARRVFTHQTGQALIALGTFFKHIPPFNESIDKNTGDTLISIGRKLKK